MSDIHPTAIIADTAEIGSGTTVGPYSVIGPKVKIGSGNTIASHVVIEGNTETVSYTHLTLPTKA